MNIVSFLSDIEQHGIRIYLDDGQLKCIAPRNGLTAATKQALQTRKQEIIRFLTASEHTPAPAIEAVPRNGSLPLSYSQQRLWFLDRLQPGGIEYNIPGALRLRGHLDRIAFTRTMNEIVRRHEVLRTSFGEDAGQAVQRIVPSEELHIPTHNLRGLVPSEREAELHKLALEEARRPFDLSRTPLLRVSLIELGVCPETGVPEVVVLITLHHIVSDGWSMAVLVREFTALYEAFSQSLPSPLTDLPIQYADYAAWQRQWLRGEVLDHLLAYWRSRLHGAPTVLELPTDRPRPAVQSYRGTDYIFRISRELTERLKALCRQEGLTLFMGLLAAFKVLLSRYSGQYDLCVGTTVANRTRTESEDLIGFFVNTLVLRTDLSGNPSVRELLKRIREICLGAQTHQDLPFEKLVEELQPERDMGHNPLFQVMFTLENTPSTELSLAGLRVSRLEVDTGTTQFDLSLNLREVEDGLQAYLQYSTDLFDRDRIERMASHFQILLNGMVANPKARLSELSLLTDSERHQLLVEWNATEAEFPRDQCIHQLFEAQVARMPEAVAVVFEDQRLTYRELNAKANQLAHYLRSLGVGLETVVGLCSRRSTELVVAVLAILKAGAAYLPLDPDYPKERLARLVEDAGLHWILVQPDCLGVLPEASAQILPLEASFADCTGQPETNPVVSLALAQLAYVLYTSGSTGQPKAVGCLHEGLLNRLHWMQDRFGLRPEDAVLQKTPYSFDVSVWEFLWPLMTGARLVVAEPEAHRDPARLVSLIEAHQITTIHFVPSMLQAFLEDADAPRCRSLKRVICSGETLTAEQRQRYFERFDAELHNLYGPTEASIDVTAWQCRPADHDPTVPIGRPIANTRIYVLDRQGDPVPTGVPGELCIGGVQLARGYLRRPDLTAERFIPNPFGDKPGERLYKTGDLARYQPDGNIEYLGRIDHQVKIRGFRIELGEIEARLREHPDVKEAVVAAREDVPGDKRLVAYLVGNDEAPVNPDRLRAHLQAVLPDYMVPTAFVTLDALPLTASGKLDRKALPTPDLSVQRKREYVAPRTPTEQILASIWAEVLGVDQVGIYDSLFELGGDSILSIQVVSRARQHGLTISPRDIFQHQTIAELNCVCSLDPSMLAEQGLVTGEPPLTAIQHWFFEKALPVPGHWNQSVLLKLKQPLSPGFLEAMVDYVERHHDALRLRFLKTAGGWQQVCVADIGSDVLQRVDLSESPPSELERTLEAETARWQSSLDLSNGPIWRVVQFDLGRDQPGRLLIIIHHLAVDGVSWRILLEDIHRLHSQFVQAQPLSLPPKTTSFKDWSQRLQQFIAQGGVHDESDFWLELAQIDIKTLPVDYPTGANSEATAAEIKVTLSKSDTDALLREALSAYNTQINDLLLAALAQTFCAWNDTKNVLVSLEGHGREELFGVADLSRTVGWFTSEFPVALRVEPVATAGEHIKSIKEQLRAIPRHGVGWGLLRYLDPTHVAERLAALPKPQVSFNYLGQFDRSFPADSPFALAPESSGPERHATGERGEEIAINASIFDGRLEVHWQYSAARYNCKTVKRLASSYLDNLQALIQHCLDPESWGYTPSDFPLAGIDQTQLDDLLSRLGTYSTESA